MKEEYPTRCKIVEASLGITLFDKMISFETPSGNRRETRRKTPDVSKPHIGKLGKAELIDDEVRITLDDGNIIWGYECWWIPI